MGQGARITKVVALAYQEEGKGARDDKRTVYILVMRTRSRIDDDDVVRLENCNIKMQIVL